MSYRDWPMSVSGNEFELAKLDPELPPASMKVVTWSNLFGEGGNVSIEGYDASGARISSGFGSIRIERSRSVLDEREHLQDLLDDFMTELPENWRSLIDSARASTAAYYARQAAEYAEKAADAAQGVFK